jgi:hypothetical protein
MRMRTAVNPYWPQGLFGKELATFATMTRLLVRRSLSRLEQLPGQDSNLEKQDQNLL